MKKSDYVADLIPCPVEDCDCPYWDWKYQKCAMLAQGEGYPQDECDAFDGIEDEDF